MICWLLPLLLTATPWWDDYPTTIQSHDPAKVAASGATSCVSGLADDPTWGIHAARIRYLWLRPQVAAIAAAGVKPMCWVETFGTAQEYLAELRRAGDGYVGHDDEPATARVFVNHWGWHTFEPTAASELAWIGISSYYDDLPHARPWTRTHPRYGAPPFTYPDGRPAVGRLVQDDPRTARIFDAGGSKTVGGEVQFEHGLNARVNAPAADRPGGVAGPIDGLLAHATRDGRRYGGTVSAGRDFACPHWLEYTRAQARHVLDCGLVGIWADNFSAWDAIGNPPVAKSFGDWSVAGFGPWLAERVPAAEWLAAGLDPATVDIRAALREVMQARYGGDPTNLRHPAWRDRRWLTEPLWRWFREYKVETGRQALQAFADIWHEEARAAGVADFVIQGNDIPIYSLGMPRPSSLDMVSTEFSPGWNLFSGPRGVGLPPDGRVSALIKTARVHAKSRFVHVWYYLDHGYETHQSDEGLARRLSYELLAHQAMVHSQPGKPRVLGNETLQAEVNQFITAMRPVWGDRRPVARIALVYSPTSQLAELTPGGMVDFAAQQHNFDLLGWGTLLSEGHWQYDVVPEWDLTGPEALAGYRVVVLPSTLELPSEATAALQAWQRSGGRLLASGEVEAAVASAERLPALGFDYYQVAPAGRDRQGALARVAELVVGHGLTAGQLPREVEAVVLRSPSSGTVFCDLANLGTEPQGPLTVRLAGELLPGGAAQAIGCTPALPAGTAVPVRREGDDLVVGPVTVTDYLSLVVRLAD